MALSVTLGNLRDDVGGRVLPDPDHLVSRLFASVQNLDAPATEFAVLASIDPGQDETILNWLQVQKLHEEISRAARLAGLHDEAKDILAELWEWRQGAIDFTWIARVADE